MANRKQVQTARRTRDMESSAIREIMKVVSLPGMVSLAGGMPDPSTFPVEHIKELFGEVVEKYGRDIYQYGITEGFMPLRESLSDYLLRQKGIESSAEEICISTGSQNAIDAIGKVLIDKDDFVAVESPTYLAAIKSFRTYEANLVSIKSDSEGIIVEDLETKMRERDIKFIYTIPNFQNPTGRTMGLERRKQLADLSRKTGVLIVEDDPYFELRYFGEDMPSIKSFIPENVIYLGSFSKILSPGIRIGYYLAPQNIFRLMTSTRQANDVHANKVFQAIAAEYILRGYIYDQLKNIRQIYNEKLQSMMRALEKYFTDIATWTSPSGGMFVWVDLKDDEIDTEKIYYKAVEKKVAYVPGKFFYAHSGDVGRSTMRLNFTNVDISHIEKAIRILKNDIFS